MSSKFIRNLEKNILKGISQPNSGADNKKMCRITSGHNEIEILKSLMFNYFKKIQDETEDILKTKDHERAEFLAKDIKQFLIVCYMQNKRIKDVRRENQLNYEDILASLLSFYIDLHSVMSIEDQKKMGRKLCSFVLYVTDECPDCRLGVLLDLCSASEDFVDVLLPTVRKCLLLNEEEITEEHYLKYILVIRTMVKKFGDCLNEEQKAAKRITAPKQFVEWLKFHKKEAQEELSNIYKMSPSKLTAFLLDEASEELMDLLQDIVIDLSSSKLSEFESQNRTSEVSICEDTGRPEVSHLQMESTKETCIPIHLDREESEDPLEQELKADSEQKDDEPYFFVDKLGSGLLKIPHDSVESQAYSDNDDEVLDDNEEHPQHNEELSFSDRTDTKTTDHQEQEASQPFFVDKKASHFLKPHQTSVVPQAYSDKDNELLDDSEEHPQHNEELPLRSYTQTKDHQEQDIEVFQPFFVDKKGSDFKKTHQTSVPVDEKIKNKESDKNEPVKTKNMKNKKRTATVILPSPEVQKSKIAKTKSKESHSYCLRSKRNLKRKKFSTAV